MDVGELTQEFFEAYHQLRLDSEIEYPEFVGFNAERELDAGFDKLQELLLNYRSEGTRIFAVVEDDVLVGVIAASRRLSAKYLHKAFVWGMYVIPAYRATGAAKALIEYVIEWANNHSDIIALTLQVTESNARAQAFYKRYGFVTFGTEDNGLFAADKFHQVHYMELGTDNSLK